MPKILFIHTQTLYAKATIPIALQCVKNGWDVTFHVNRPIILGRSAPLSEQDIKKRYTGVSILTPDAYRFISKIIALDNAWSLVAQDISYSFLAKYLPSRFDVVVGAVKDIPLLRYLSKSGIPSFYVGYQHFPVFGRINGALAQLDNEGTRTSIFFSENPFSKSHKFYEQVEGTSYRLCNFPHLDAVYRVNSATNEKDNTVLIFHPGGYRGVLSEPGDDQATCYCAQKLFLEQVCIPLLEHGLKPLIKIHPLRALHHDLDDMEELVSEFEDQYQFAKGAIELIGPTEWHWQKAFHASFILTFGSSAVYELWAAGLKNVLVCNFLGTSRSERFDFFEDIFIRTHQEYLQGIKTFGSTSPSSGCLTGQVFESFSALFQGNSTQTVFAELEAAL
jgi:hypothetical protein